MKTDLKADTIRAGADNNSVNCYSPEKNNPLIIKSNYLPNK